MKKFKEVKITEKHLTSIICDMCKKEYDIEEDVFEFQEMISIYNHGGYGSIFGDGFEFEMDICQHCLKKIVDKFDIKLEDYDAWSS